MISEENRNEAIARLKQVAGYHRVYSRPDSISLEFLWAGGPDGRMCLKIDEIVQDFIKQHDLSSVLSYNMDDLEDGSRSGQKGGGYSRLVIPITNATSSDKLEASIEKLENLAPEFRKMVSEVLGRTYEFAVLDFPIRPDAADAMRAGGIDPTGYDYKELANFLDDARANNVPFDKAYFEMLENQPTIAGFIKKSNSNNVKDALEEIHDGARAAGKEKEAIQFLEFLSTEVPAFAPLVKNALNALRSNSMQRAS